MSGQLPELQTSAGGVSDSSPATLDRDLLLTAAGAPPSHGLVDADTVPTLVRGTVQRLLPWLVPLVLLATWQGASSFG